MSAARQRIQQVRSHEHRHLLDGSAAALIAIAVTAASGFLFWLVAARTSSADDVGRATALMSSVLFLAYLTNMGLGVAVGRYSVDDSDLHRARFAVACAYTAATGTVAAVIYLALVRGGPAQILGPVGLAAFVFVTIGTSLGPLVDTRQMARRRWRMVVLRPSAVFVGRLVLLVGVLLWAPAPQRSTLLFFAATVPDSVTGWGCAAVLSARGALAMVRDRALPELKVAFRYANVNYLSNLAIMGPIVATPVIVLLNVTPDENAAFYVAWAIFGIALLVPQSLTNALHVEGKKDGADLRTQVAFGLRLSAGASAVCFVLSFGVAFLIPIVYGSAYTSSGKLLPFLVASAVPWAVLLVKLTAARVEERTGATVLISVTFAVGSLLPILVLTPVLGLAGPAVGWLFGTVVAASVALLVQRRADRVEHVDYAAARERFIESIHL